MRGLADVYKRQPIAYPDEETLARGEAFGALSVEATQLMDSLWNDIRGDAA